MHKLMKRGDPNEAFTDLLEGHSDAIGRFLFLILSDPLDAEDLYHEVFLHCWKDPPRSPTRVALLASALHLLRRHRRKARTVGYTPVKAGREAPAAPRMAQLRRAWDAVPLSERIPIALCEETGLTLQAVSTLLRSSVAPTRRRLMRGLLRFERGTGRHGGRIPHPCDEGARKLVRSRWDDGGLEREGEWSAHCGQCPRCGASAPVLVHSLELLERLAAKVFRPSTRNRLRRRLRRNLPSPRSLLLYDWLPSPIGRIWVGLLDGSVVRISIADRTEEEWVRSVVPAFAPQARRDRAAVARPRRELDEYFSGRRMVFSFPYRLPRATPFQADVLAACANVPFGSVSSYKSLAVKVGRPRATRAVGGALGRNPLPVVIPCHRILSSDGRLHGFSSGLDLKEKLLALEGMAGLFSSTRA